MRLCGGAGEREGETESRRCCCWARSLFEWASEWLDCVAPFGPLAGLWWPLWPMTGLGSDQCWAETDTHSTMAISAATPLTSLTTYVRTQHTHTPSSLTSCPLIFTIGSAPSSVYALSFHLAATSFHSPPSSLLHRTCCCPHCTLPPLLTFLPSNHVPLSPPLSPNCRYLPVSSSVSTLTHPTHRLLAANG